MIYFVYCIVRGLFDIHHSTFSFELQCVAVCSILGRFWQQNSANQVDGKSAVLRHNDFTSTHKKLRLSRRFICTNDLLQSHSIRHCSNYSAMVWQLPQRRMYDLQLYDIAAKPSNFNKVARI